MGQYIKKSDIVVEIERRLEAIANASNESSRELAAIQGAQRYELISLIQFLNTLEVKEVDLEKEFDNYTKDILACDVQFEPFTHLYNCAKHFFELGMQQSKR